MRLFREHVVSLSGCKDAVRMDNHNTAEDW